MNASFTEKSVWIQFVATIVALGGYFAVAWSMYARGIDVLVPYVPLFFAAVFVMGMILIIGHVLAAIFGKWEQPDERDRLIHWRSESNSAWVLVVGIFATVACMVFAINNVLVAHVLLLSLFLAQMYQFGLQIIYYRRGM